MLEGKKTYIVALLMLLKAAADYLLGGSGTGVDWNLVLEAFGLAALRRGVGKA